MLAILFVILFAFNAEFSQQLFMLEDGELSAVSGEQIRFALERLDERIDSLQLRLIGQRLEGTVIQTDALPNGVFMVRLQDQDAVVYTNKAPAFDKVRTYAIFFSFLNEGDVQIPMYIAKGFSKLNAGLFDDLPRKSVAEMQSSDFKASSLFWSKNDDEPFFSILSFARTHRFPPSGITQFDAINKLFNQPEKIKDEVFTVTGTAKRISRIEIANAAIAELFGLSHYYEIFMFLPEAEGNPIVFYASELPEGMPQGDSEHFAEQITVSGFYYRTWAYRIEKPDGKKSVQLSPVLIGRNAIWHPESGTAESEAATRYSVYTYTGLFALAIFWGIYRFLRAGICDPTAK